MKRPKLRMFGAALCGCLGIVAASLYSTSAVVADDPTPTPYFLTATAFSEADNCTPLSLTSVQYITPSGGLTNDFSDGDGILNTYDDGFGGSLTQTYPPNDWNPETATDAQLAMYDFPPRPTDPAPLAQWEDTYSNFKGYYMQTPCMENSGMQIGADPTLNTNPDGLSTATGALALVSGPHHNNVWSEAQITVPNYSYPPSCNPSLESQWQGFANAAKTSLVQNGLFSHPSGGSGDLLFYQQISPSQIYNAVYPGHVDNPGDVIVTDMTWTASTGHMHYSWYDKTSGYSWPTSSPIDHGAYSGYQALYTVERVDPAGYSLRSFNDQHFTSEFLEYGTGNYIHPGGPGQVETFYDMKSGSTPLADISGHSPNSMIVHWQNCS